ncbi:MAG TPA: LacI family DNA-binding transcriptional regulator [Microlunatus sp.]
MSSSCPTRPATIADVAARAGVSPATVSRVMNGTRTVDEEMTERVRMAARELDYSPSPLARSLVLGRTNTVAVVVPDLGNPTFHGVLRGLSHAAARNGFHVLVADSAESVADEMVLARQTRRRCDGLVLVAPRTAEPDLEQLLTSLRPVVVVNRELSADTGTPVVTADYRVGLTGLLELLYADGHRSLMFLAGAPQSASNTRRLAALDAFLVAHPDLIVEIRACGVNFADGYDAAGAIAASGVTGVLAFNDLVAMGLISALTEAGIAIPAAMSVVGFDDIPFARYVTPPLTTAAVPVAEMGEQAWQRMWDLLSGRPPGPTLVLSPHVVRRGSAGPAPDPGEQLNRGTANGP